MDHVLEENVESPPIDFYPVLSPSSMLHYE